jgi:hypothetical protein
MSDSELTSFMLDPTTENRVGLTKAGHKGGKLAKPFKNLSRGCMPLPPSTIKRSKPTTTTL